MPGLMEELLALASQAGFDAAGVCRATPFPEMKHLSEWCAAGMHAEMGYMPRRAAERTDPSRLVPRARSILMLALSYWSETSATQQTEVARFARGDDYHVTMRSRLDRVASFLADRGHSARAFVDTSPVMEKVLAAQAGLGWRGWNTLLITPTHGSWVVLGGVATDADLEESPPLPGGPDCSACRRCIDACPTHALSPPGFLDARRCIAYWTIEARNDPPPDVKAHIKPGAYGCDICQLVCPANHEQSNESWIAQRQALVSRW